MDALSPKRPILLLWHFWNQIQTVNGFFRRCHFRPWPYHLWRVRVVLNIFGSCFGNLFFGWWNSTRRWSWGWVWYSPREAQLQEADVTLWWFETVLYLSHWFIFILVPWSRQRCISIVKAVCLVETCVPLSSMSTRHFSVRGMSLPQRKKKITCVPCAIVIDEHHVASLVFLCCRGRNTGRLPHIIQLFWYPFAKLLKCAMIIVSYMLRVCMDMCNINRATGI